MYNPSRNRRATLYVFSNSLHYLYALSKAAANRHPHSNHAGSPLDSHHLSAPSPPPRNPICRLEPSHQPHHNNLHSLPSHLPAPLRNRLRYTRPPSHLPYHLRSLHHRQPRPGPQPAQLRRPARSASAAKLRRVRCPRCRVRRHRGCVPAR